MVCLFLIFLTFIPDQNVVAAQNYQRQKTQFQTVKQYGWAKENGKWYYADDDGHFYQNSWVRTYYTPFDEEAIIVGSEPVRTSGTIQWSRYFRSDCSMAVGWEKIGADWYYFKADGSVYNGWLSSGGKWYYLKDGVMQVNTTIDGYQIGSDGVWIR